MREAYFGDREHAWFAFKLLRKEWAIIYSQMPYSQKPEDQKEPGYGKPVPRLVPGPDIDGSTVTFANEQFGRFNAIVEKLSAKRHVKVRLA